MDKKDDFDFDKISEFNIALANLFVIRGILSGCLISAKNLDYSNWMHYLLNLHQEIKRYIKSPEEKKKKLDELEKLFNKVNEYSNTTEEEGCNREIYWELYTMEGYLRDVLDKSGVLDKFKDDPRSALTG